jgi:hypothetical protein
MKKWTENGREPSKSERKSVDVGLIAARECIARYPECQCGSLVRARDVTGHLDYFCVARHTASAVSSSLRFLASDY